MLMEIRQDLITEELPMPTPAADPKMIPISALPYRVQRSLEALNINVQHLHVTPEYMRLILSKMNQGEMVLSIGGNRSNEAMVIGRYENREWVPYTADEMRARKISFAIKQGWIANESEWTQAVETRVDTYNRTQTEAQEAAYALGEALALSPESGVLVSGGASGTDIRGIVGNVGKGATRNLKACLLYTSPSPRDS